MKFLLNKQCLKVRQLTVLVMLIFLFLMNGQAQTTEMRASGDSLNRKDNAGLKQGKWVNHIDEIRGEPGYEEEGMYKDDKKEGVWRLYSLDGDLIGLENYKFGGKDGLQQYFTYLGDLVREENWRGYNPDAPYDTVDVYGTGSNEIIDRKIVKAVQYSVKHGEWKYYEAGTGRLIKVEKYDRGLLEKPGGQPSATTAPAANAPKKPDKTPEMIEWEKKNKGKKKVVRDGRTGI